MLNRKPVQAIGVALGLVLLAIPSGHAQPRRTAEASNHVVIISLDGFPASALDDPYLPVPALRRLAARGAVAKAMRPVDPTVTWANHTSMVTGVPPAKHGVIFNGLLVREPGVPPRVEPWRDKADMVRGVTLYDAVHAAGMTTAQVDWVAIWNAPTITWEFRERPAITDAVPREMIKAGLISEADVASFATRNIIWRDEVWTDAAVHILKQHRPNLLLFHLLNLDSTQHRYGPRTPAAMTTMAHLDTQVARIVAAIEQAGMSARTTILVVSDHGFKTVTRQIRPNAAFQRAGLVTVVDGKITKAEGYSYPEGGTALVYVTVPDPAGSILIRIKASLQGIEGLDTIVEPSDYAKYGLPQPSDNNQMGALFLTAKDGYAFTGDVGDELVVDAPAASLGSHGYVATAPDMRAIFIASGRGIRRGTRLDEVSNLDIAPTVAQLLGVTLKDVEGRVLKEILVSPAR